MILSTLSNLKQRLAVSSIAVLFLLLVIYFSSYPIFRPIFALAVAGAVGFAVWEYYQIAIAKQFAPLIKLGITCAVAYVFATFLYTQGIWPSLMPPIVLVGSLFLFSLYFLFHADNPLVNLAITIFGLAYLALPLSLTVDINYFFKDTTVQDGRWWLFYLLSVTKMTDTGAYFIGRFFGKHKLAPHISPKKTIEGAIGGMLFSIGISLLFAWLSNAFPTTVKLSLSYWEALWLGMAMGFVAQIGDLIESLLKRDGGIKDSNQLPGLGGMLDIVDSLIFTTPLVFFFLKIQF